MKAVGMELAFETQQEYTASAMSKKKPKSEHLEKEPRRTTPTFLLELPLVVHEGQAKRLRAHLEAGRQFYNAVLSAGQKRLRRMRADPAWQQARALPRTQKQERKAAFAALREQYGFSEYAFHELARKLHVSFLADHLDAVLAQTLATRAYRAINRVCVGEARRARFKSKNRGLDSIENKRNDTGLRCVLQKPEEGNAGHLIWQKDHLPALVDWGDEVVAYGLRHRIKYARLVQRRASSERAAGADQEAYRYFVQLALEGIPLQKPKHPVGRDIIGADLGPSTIALVPRAGEASLEPLCEELAPNAQQIRRLQRRMERQRRAANPDNYDARGRTKKQGKQRLHWKTSKSYEQTRRRKAAKERRLSAHRKSLHGCLVHAIVAVGNTIIIEKLSYKAWQKQYGRSVGLRAPGMFVAQLRRTVASTGGTLIEVPTRQTKLSQFCHGCGRHVKKPLSQRWHHCPCGVGPVQRDLYAAFLASTLSADHLIPSCAQAVIPWESAEARLQAAHARVLQRANEGQVLPRSMGVPCAGARRPQSLGKATPELLFLSMRGRVEAWKHRSEPPRL
jgi:hypothetical protein